MEEACGSESWRPAPGYFESCHRVEWDGQKWWLNQGYYKNRKGELLHRAIYRRFVGEIPEEFDVHHKDEDKTHNHPSNLEAIPRGDHLRRHEPRGFIADTQEERHARRLKIWQNREPVERECHFCGSKFMSTGMRSKYCNYLCRSRHYAVVKPPREKPWKRDPSIPTPKISEGTRKRHYKRVSAGERPPKERKKKPPMVCLVCGAEFPRKGYTETCGYECGWALRRQRWAEKRERGEASRKSCGVQPGS